jgi:CRP/FNR family transcriptional regulator, cyclic AMP receptor protein
MADDERLETGESAPVQFLGDGASLSGKIADLLQKMPLFSGFSLEEIHRLAAFMELFRAEIGVAILREGDPGDYMMLLLEGQVNVLRNDHQNRQKLIGTILPGETFGEMSMVDGEPRFATCVTVAPALYAVLSRDTLARIINDEPRLGAKLLVELLEMLTQRLRQTSDMLVDYLKIS